MHVVAGDRGVPGVLAREKDQASRSANGVSRIVIGEAEAFLRHTIQSRRLDLLLSIASQVAVTKVVGHDVNNVRFARRGVENAN